MDRATGLLSVPDVPRGVPDSVHCFGARGEKVHPSTYMFKTSGLLPHMLSEYLIRLAKLSTVIQGTSNVPSASVLLWVTVAHFPFRILSCK